MKTKTLNLETQHGKTSAFVAVPAEGDAPAIDGAAVILIHEWWGVNDHVRDLARRYAKEGYLCVAPDLFRGKTTRDAGEASRLMQELSMDDGVETIRQTIAETRRAYGVERIGITGYCMGGTFALRAACELEELRAAAPFYGDIPDEETLSRLRVPTLFIAGSRDNWITPEKVEGLAEAARKYDLPVKIISYDADHAFFNDTRPEVYNPDAAADAWQRILAFFGEHLQQRS